jgi:hypothetical protein
LLIRGYLAFSKLAGFFIVLNAAVVVDTYKSALIILSNCSELYTSYIFVLKNGTKIKKEGQHIR